MKIIVSNIPIVEKHVLGTMTKNENTHNLNVYADFNEFFDEKFSIYPTSGTVIDYNFLCSPRHELKDDVRLQRKYLGYMYIMDVSFFCRSGGYEPVKYDLEIRFYPPEENKENKENKKLIQIGEKFGIIEYILKSQNIENKKAELELHISELKKMIM